MNISRILNTIRHLLPVQIYGRLLYIFRRRFSQAGQPGDTCKLAAELKGQLLVDVSTSFKLSFLNTDHLFSPGQMKWQAGDFSDKPEKLWLYQLNYFDWLFDGQSECFSQQNLYLILDWIEKNSDSRGETWEPYPLSRRITTWVRWCREHPSLADEFSGCIKSSISLQCDRLMVDLEYHNQGNHLLENLKALFVATAYLAEDEDSLPEEFEQRLEFCIDELVEQIRLQFLSDGGHFERSPMYHLEMLEAVETARAANRKLLELNGLSQKLNRKMARLAMVCGDKIPLMRDWLAVLTHPDGNIAQFNDSALLPGIKRDWKSMSYLLESSGFFVRRTPDSYFAMSCGEPSPAFQPGHSHCDIHSFELSLGGQRCIIDTGCGSYQNNQIREECRQTSAHNVAMVEHAEQSDIWDAFRIGRRAVITHRSYDSENGLLVVEFTDQYDQKFRREVVFGPNSIKVRDRMTGRRITGTFVSLLHLAPGVTIRSESESGVQSFQVGSNEFRITSSARIRTSAYAWYPDFGRPINAEKLVLSNPEAEAIDYVITWQPA